MLSKLGRILRKHSKGHFRISHGDKSFLVPKRNEPDHILNAMIGSGDFYEADLLKAISHLLIEQQGIALDCGANIGNHTLYFAGVMQLETYAFEPVTSNRAALERLVQMNALSSRVHIVAKALSDRNGSVKLSNPELGNPGMFRISDTGEDAEAVTLDEFILTEGIKPEAIRIAKIDVEGHELSVLRGGMETLAQMDGLIVVEVTSIDQYDAILDEIGQIGFQPSACFCATPTIIYTRTKPSTAGKAIRARISKFELSQ